jgi:hypothetical protein
MDKTLRLLEMGFSNDEISMAIEKIGEQLRHLSVHPMTVICLKEKNVDMKRILFMLSGVIMILLG